MTGQAKQKPRRSPAWHFALAAVVFLVIVNPPAVFAKAADQHPCSLIKFDPAYIQSTGFHYRPLTDEEKKNTADYIKRTQGKPPPWIEIYPRLSAYLIFYTAVNTPNGAAYSTDSRIYFVDDYQCVVLRIADDVATTKHIIAGTWSLSVH